MVFGAGKAKGQFNWSAVVAKAAQPMKNVPEFLREAVEYGRTITALTRLTAVQREITKLLAMPAKNLTAEIESIIAGFFIAFRHTRNSE